MSVTRLVLVRHGQTSSNVARALDTARPGASLTDLGGQQARSLVDTLQDVPDLGVVAASPLLRTQQTARPLAEARGLPVRVVEGLQEIEAGDLEMACDDDSVGRYLHAVAAWAEGDLDVTVPGGRDGHAFVARFDAAVDEVLGAAAGSGSAVVVSHGAAIRCWVTLRVGNVPPALVLAEGLGNTGVVDLRRDPTSGSLTCLTWQGDPLDGVPHVGPATGPGGEPAPGS